MAKRFFIFILCLWPVSLIQAQQADQLSDYTIIKDFTSEWLVYDSDLDSYVPYVLNSPFDYQTASFYLNSRQFSGGKLVCALQEGSSLLVNQKMIAHFPQSRIALFDVDSLAAEFGTPRLFVSIYHPQFDLEKNQIGITANTFTIPADQSGYGAILNILARQKSYLGDFIITVILFLAACIAALRYRYPKFSKDFLNIPKAYALNLRNIRGEIQNVQKTPGQINLFFILVYALLLAFILLIVLPATVQVPRLISWLDYNNLWQLYGQWLKVSAILLILMALKYFWISLMAAMFDVGEVNQMHFFDYLKMGLIFYILVGLSVVIFVSRPEISKDDFSFTVGYGLIAFSLFRVLMLFFKLNNLRLLRGVELFSYLCGTEVIPLVIGLKILLNS